MDDEILNTALKRAPDCIDVERLGRFVDGAVAPDERASIAAHVDRCLACQAEISMIHAFQQDRIDPGEADAVRDIVRQLSRRPSPIPAASRSESRVRATFSLGTLRAFLMTSAALLAVAAVSVVLFRSSAPHLPTDIDAGHEVTRSLRVMLGAPSGDQAAPPRRFEWSAVPGAARYRVRLTEVDRSQLWTADSSDSGIDVPDAVRAKMVSGKTLVWDVTAYDTSNTAIATSDPQRFRVAP